MEVYINGEKVELGLKTSKLLSVLEKIESKFLNHGDIIIELKIDGEHIMGDTLPLDKKIKILELRTRSHREILIESLYLFDTLMDKFSNSYKELENDPGNIARVYELVSFIEWCLGILLSIKEATKIDMLYCDFDEFLEDFKKYTEELFIAFKNEKYLEAMEIIDGVLLDLVMDLSANSADYLKEAIKEESLKNMPN